MFSSTGWQRKGVPGCDPQQTMPRELGLSSPSETADNGGVPFLTAAPVVEARLLRTTARPYRSGNLTSTPLVLEAVGAQLELRVVCPGPMAKTAAVSAEVLLSGGGDAGVAVRYSAGNLSMHVDHRAANPSSPSPLLQLAPVPAGVFARPQIELVVMVDGGMVESFLASRVAITSLIGLPDPAGPPPGPPPRPPPKSCSVVTVRGCIKETYCGSDPRQRCLPNLVGATGTRESCAASCYVRGYSLAGVEEDQCWCGDGIGPACGAVLPAASCDHPCRGKPSESCGGKCKVDVYTFACKAPPPAPPAPPAPPPKSVTPPQSRGVRVTATGVPGGCAVSAWQLRL